MDIRKKALIVENNIPYMRGLHSHLCECLTAKYSSPTQIMIIKDVVEREYRKLEER